MRAAFFEAHQVNMSTSDPPPVWPEDPSTRGRVVDDDRRNRLLALVRAKGDAYAAERAGVGRTTVWRALAQLGMYEAGFNAIVAFVDRECPKR